MSEHLQDATFHNNENEKVTKRISKAMSSTPSSDYHLNHRDEQVFFDAVEAGDAILVRSFRNVWNPSKVRKGVTALVIANTRGHIEVVKALLEFDNSPGHVVTRGKGRWAESLMNASQNGHTEVVKLLIEVCRSADDGRGNITRRRQEKFNRRTALMLASLNGHVNVLKALLQFNDSVLHVTCHKT